MCSRRWAVPTRYVAAAKLTLPDESPFRITRTPCLDGLVPIDTRNVLSTRSFA